MVADKAARAINILSNSTSTLAEKEDELARTVIPLYDKFKGFLDAISGVTEALRVMKMQTELIVGGNKAFYSYEAGRFQEEGRGRQAAAVGYAAGALPFGGGVDSADLMSVGGRAAYEDALRMQSAQDNFVRAQRATLAARQVDAGNRAELGTAQTRYGHALRWNNMASDWFNQSRDRQNMGGPWTRAAIGGALPFRIDERGMPVANFGVGLGGAAMGFAEGQLAELDYRRSQEERTRAQSAFSGASSQLEAAQRAAQTSNIELIKRENEEKRAGLQIDQEQLAILERREQRMGALQQRIGGMTENQYQMGLSALRQVQQLGIEGVTPEAAQRAASIAPQFIARRYNERGIGRIGGALGEFAGVDDFFDAAAGHTQAGTQRDIVSLRARIREGMNALETTLPQETAQAMAESIKEIVKIMMDRFEQEMKKLRDDIVSRGR
jgi:flagellin-specific chaperone FliS